MKVEELIEKLKELPKDATIGSFDAEDMSISDYVSIYNKKDRVFTAHGETNIQKVEQGRYSNESRLCDYYIGY